MYLYWYYLAMQYQKSCFNPEIISHFIPCFCPTVSMSTENKKRLKKAYSVTSYRIVFLSQYKDKDSVFTPECLPELTWCSNLGKISGCWGRIVEEGIKNAPLAACSVWLWMKGTGGKKLGYMVYKLHQHCECTLNSIQHTFNISAFQVMYCT